jgi:hypothetical protein
MKEYKAISVVVVRMDMLRKSHPLIIMALLLLVVATGK